MGNCFNFEADQPPQEDVVSVLRVEEARGKPSLSSVQEERRQKQAEAALRRQQEVVYNNYSALLLALSHTHTHTHTPSKSQEVSSTQRE